MPTLSVWAVRMALVHLGVSFAAGAWLLAAQGVPSLPQTAWLRPLHLELALLGWMLQLTLGVAYWILPKFPTAPDRGPIAPVVAAFALLNLGVGLTVVGGARFSAPTMLAGRLAELAAVALFARSAWPRIKAFGR